MYPIMYLEQQLYIGMYVLFTKKQIINNSDMILDSVDHE